MYVTIIGISTLLLGVFAMNLGLGLQGTLLGVRAGHEGFPIAMTGFVMASYYMGYIGGSIYAPRLVQTVGHIRTFAALASLASTGALLHALFVDPIIWSVLRILTGFCGAGMLVVVESWLNNSSTNTDRGSILSVYMVVALIATALGQLLLNVAPVDGFTLFILISVLVSICLVPMALTTQNAPPLQPTTPMALRRLFALSPTGVIACFATGVITSAFASMGAVYAHAVHLDTRDISIFVAAGVVGGIFSQLPLGRLSDHIDRRIVIMGLAFMLAICSVVIAIIGGRAPMALFALSALYGACTYPLYTISIAHVNDQISADDFVPASSALLLTYALGAIVGPFIGGWMMSSIGAGGMFYFLSVVAIATGAFVLSRLRFGTTIRAEDKDTYITVPKTSVQSLEMAGQIHEEAAHDDTAEKPAA